MPLRMTKARIESYVRNRHRFLIKLEPYAKNSKGKVQERLWELRVLTSQIKTRPGYWRTRVVFQAETRQEVIDRSVELLGCDTYLCYFERYAVRMEDGNYQRFDCIPDMLEWAKANGMEQPLHEMDVSISLPMAVDDKHVFEKVDYEVGPRPRLAEDTC